MKKEQIDQLYHLLRVASNVPKGDASSWIEQAIIYGLARHLLAGGDYQALIQFSAFYGEKYLLQPTYEAIKKADWKPKRIVDFGAGLGWLGRGLAVEFGYLPALFVDKRQWTMIDLVADLETKEGRAKISKALLKNDLIVACDLLHCLNNPVEVMSAFARWPAAILEYCPEDMLYRASYNEQITRYGAKPVDPESYETMFPGRKVDIIDLDPYILLLIEGNEQERK